MAAAYRAGHRHLADAGCRYLQLDDITFAYLCDPKIREQLPRATATTRPRCRARYADVINAALVGQAGRT